MLKISAGSSDLGGLKAPALALLLEQPVSADNLGALDAALASAIRRVVSRRDFRGARDETLHLLGAENGVERVLLIGMGKIGDRAASLRRASALAARRATQGGFGSLSIYAGNIDGDDAEAIALGAIAGAWEMKEYQTPVPEDERRATLTEVTVHAPNGNAASAGVARGRAIGEGHSLARRLAMLPGNVCTPDYLADTARDIAKRHGMQVTVLGRAEMEK